MKKLFTLSISIFCVVALNAQFSESGNGFLERFDYAEGTIYDSVAYEDVGAEWPDGAVVEDSILKWDLEAEGEGAIGLWELEMDLSENAEFRFKYKFPAGGEFGVWIEDNAGGGGEIFPEDFILGLDELQDYTFDASAIEDVDLSDVAEIWIMSFAPTAGTFYLDDLAFGDGWSMTRISEKAVNRSLKVYPNPASSEFRIDSDINSLSVYNSIGQKVYSVKEYQRGSSVDISNFGKGLYIIKADDINHKLLVK